MDGGGVNRGVENPHVEYGEETLFCAETGHPLAPLSNDTHEIDGPLPRSDPYQHVWGPKGGDEGHAD